MSRRAIGVVGAVATAAAISASAGATGTRDALIRPGIGIGKIRLGMPAGEARRAFGRPLILRRSVRIRGFRTNRWYTEFQTADAVWRIAFFGERGRERVVLVGTSARRERTADGIGVGTAVDTLPQRLRPARAECLKHPLVNVKGAIYKGPWTVACAIVTEAATTIFSGNATCAVPTPGRYPGCPADKVRIPVTTVYVESAILRRYRLAYWSQR